MINEITINGKIEIDKPIDPEKEYSIYLERAQNDQGKVSKWINKDDESVYTYKMVNLDIAILKEGNEVIKGKAKKSKKSVALRMKIKELWEIAHSGRISEEDFYNECMNKYLDEAQEQIDIY